MNEYVIIQKINELESKMDIVAVLLKSIENSKALDNDLWDNADIIRKWKVSERTIASWRSNKQIGYTKVNGKIYYTPEDRALFLSKNHVNENVIGNERLLDRRSMEERHTKSAEL
jgi:hypothetical protein